MKNAIVMAALGMSLCISALSQRMVCDDNLCRFEMSKSPAETATSEDGASAAAGKTRL